MCDSIVATAPHTAGRRTLYAKNSDRKPGECQPLIQLPESHHPAGSRVRCTHIEIPQVAETYRVLGHSPWWVWGFEHGVNEHGVAVGNHTVFSNEPIEGQPGLIGMDLVRLALERGRSAREALEVVAGLIERHGQGGAALAPDATGYHNSFVLADAAEAWQLETSNRHWAARPLELAAVSNHYSIGSDWAFGSRELERFAADGDFWRERGRLDLARAFRNPHVPAHLSEGRLRRASELLTDGAGRHDPASFAAILRDHAEGGPVWQATDASPEEERFFTLCAHSEPVHTTTASLVAELPRDVETPWPVWVGFGAPCSGVLLPVYLRGTLPAALARGGENDRADSAWWGFARLQEAVAADPANRTPRVRTAWEEWERPWRDERRGAEARAAEALLADDPEAAESALDDLMLRCVASALARADDLTRALRGQALRRSSA